MAEVAEDRKETLSPGEPGAVHSSVGVPGDTGGGHLLQLEQGVIMYHKR